MRDPGGQRVADTQQSSEEVIFERIPVPLWIYDADRGTFLHVNRAAILKYGYTREEFLQMTIYDIRSEEQDSVVPKAEGHPLRKENLYGAGVYRHRTRGGDILNVMVETVILPYHGHNARMAVIRDVTEQKKFQEKLQEREALFRSIFESTSLGVCYFDTAGRLIATNKALQKMLGYTQNELSGMSFAEISYPDDSDLQKKAMEEMLSGVRTEVQLERRCYTKAGSLIWIQLSLSMVRDGENRPQFGIGIFQDITRRKREAEILLQTIDRRRMAEEALRESEERFRFMAETTGGVLYRLLYATMTYEYISPAILHLTGYTPEEINQMGFREIVVKTEVTGTSRQILEETGRRKIYPTQKFQADYLIRCKNGQLKWVGDHSYPWKDAAGRVIGSVGILLDINERKQAEEALKESRERYRQLIELSPDTILVLSEARILFLNRAGVKLFGAATAMQIIGKSLLDFALPEHRESLLRHLKEAEEGKEAQSHEETFVRLDGEIIEVEISSIAFSYQGKSTVQSVIRDITARKRDQQALRQSEERYRAFVEQCSEAIWRFELEEPVPVCLSEDQQIELFYRYGYLAECNDIMARMYGFSTAQEIIGARLHHLLVRSDPDNENFLRAFIRAGYRLVDAESHEVDKYGEPKYFANNMIGIVENGKLVRAWGSQRDITERKHAEQMIRHLAYHDALTGLPNRMLFHDRFQQALAHMQRSRELLAMLFLDLDRFKVINDTLGHAIGDELLKAVGERLLHCLREGDTIARPGGDEFMILLAGIPQAEDAAKVADKILKVIRPPFHLQGHELHVTTSIGISIFPFDGKDVETLIKNADTALYRAKEHGRDNYEMYTPAMHERAYEQLALEMDLRRALERQEFELYYQPQFYTATGQIAGVETLLRWRRSDGTLLEPKSFISLAEDTGLIVPLGDWVLRTACRQMAQWRCLPHAPRCLSVNISARQFQQQKLVENVSAILQETGLQPSFLELELTESTIMKNPDFAVQIFYEFQRMGIQISIDDFGTGYSSLSHLKKFPIMALKIDQSFVQDCISDPDDAAIVTAIVSMAHSLKLRVIAEGVENPGQLEFLRMLGCDILQGFYLSKPLAATEMEKLLIRQTRHKAITLP